jgi:hypothetical protein
MEVMKLCSAREAARLLGVGETHSGWLDAGSMIFRGIISEEKDSSFV